MSQLQNSSGKSKRSAPYSPSYPTHAEDLFSNRLSSVYQNSKNINALFKCLVYTSQSQYLSQRWPVEHLLLKECLVPTFSSWQCYLVTNLCANANKSVYPTPSQPNHSRKYFCILLNVKIQRSMLLTSFF